MMGAAHLVSLTQVAIRKKFAKDGFPTSMTKYWIMWVKDGFPTPLTNHWIIWVYLGPHSIHKNQGVGVSRVALRLESTLQVASKVVARMRIVQVVTRLLGHP